VLELVVAAETGDVPTQAHGARVPGDAARLARHVRPRRGRRARVSRSGRRDARLTNAVRHAGARRVRIAVEQKAGVVRAEIDDDGHGFDPRAPVDGFGLTGMRERVTLLHGELEIASSAGGTRVTAALPVVT
jgi:hypothetical protein